MKDEFGIYIHIPFCVKKCDYCDFLSFPMGEKKRKLYVDKLKEQICSSELGRSRKVTSIFFGGGTPSVLDKEELCGLLELLFERYSVAEDAEITCEVNPGTVDEEYLKALKRAGFNRLSMGVQSFCDEELKTLGRIHNAAMAQETFKAARRAGFTNVNLDLMGALPGQSISSFEENLHTALSMNPEHISVYSLIVEEGTPFFERYKDDMEKQRKGISPDRLPDEETERAMYHLAHDLLVSCGYEHYEISNYAKRGFHSRHNENCWKRADYLGFGLGAASLYENRRFRTVDDFQEFLQSPRFTNPEVLSKEDQIEETMFLGLRLSNGVSDTDFKAAFGQRMEDLFKEPVETLLERGLLQKKEDRLLLTMEGIDLANYCMAQFLLS